MLVKELGYDLSRTCDQIRPKYYHVESCQGTVPEAITAFLEGTNFEDVIRTAVSLGGDCDTLTCIAGSIAEAFYGVPEQLKDECRSRLPKDMLDILGRFDISREHGHDKNRQSTYGENLYSWEQRFSGYIEKARAFKLDRFLEDQGTDHFWDKPVNRVKEAILLKREDYPLEKARECFADIVGSQDDTSPITSVQKSIILLDRVYNHPVEAIMAGNDIYVRLCEDAS